jgi:hypothetical protein
MIKQTKLVHYICDRACSIVRPNLSLSDYTKKTTAAAKVDDDSEGDNDDS